jgi:hypothetical protein
MLVPKGREIEFRGGIMAMRKFLLMAAALSLSACATHAPSAQTAAASNAVYVVPEGANTTATTVAAQSASLDPTDARSPGASSLVHIYWFLGGR